VAIDLMQGQDSIGACRFSVRKVATGLARARNDAIKYAEKQIQSFLQSIFFNQTAKGCL